MKPPAMILAGGRSSRMGGCEKSLLPMGGASILQRIIAVLSPQVSRIAINSNTDAGQFRATGLAVIADIVPGRLGPLAGILTAMLWAKAMGAQNVITVACDTPFLPDNLVHRLVGRADGGVALAASGGKLHPTTGVWPVHYADKLALDLQNGTRRATAWAASMDRGVVEWCSMPCDPFWNINTPADWAWAQQSARFFASCPQPVGDSAVGVEA